MKETGFRTEGILTFFFILTVLLFSSGAAIAGVEAILIDDAYTISATTDTTSGNLAAKRH